MWPRSPFSDGRMSHLSTIHTSPAITVAMRVHSVVFVLAVKPGPAEVATLAYGPVDLPVMVATLVSLSPLGDRCLFAVLRPASYI
jgi:hypothetical protein